MANNNRKKLQLTAPVIAAIIAGIFGLTGSLIGLVTVHKENARLKLEIQRLTQKLDDKDKEIAIAIKSINDKEKAFSSAKETAENRLIALQNVVSSLNSTTLVNSYNFKDGWSGFESFPGKGEHSLQCAVDRFFLVWNNNVQKMLDSGCSGINKKATGVHHPNDCN